jgi:lipooligosaccharide transport system ATP-binding protein
MHQGHILVEGTPDALVKEHAGAEVVELHLRGPERESVLAQVAARPGLMVEEVEDILYIYARSTDGRADIAELAAESERVVYRHANLEDVFLRLTGRGLVE